MLSFYKLKGVSYVSEPGQIENIPLKLYTKASTLETKRVRKGAGVETLRLMAQIYGIIGAVIAVVAFISFICGLISGRKDYRSWNCGEEKKAERFLWKSLYWILGLVGSVILAIVCGTLWPVVIGYLVKENWPFRRSKKGPA